LIVFYPDKLYLSLHFECRFAAGWHLKTKIAMLFSFLSLFFGRSPRCAALASGRAIAYMLRAAALAYRLYP
jgi:hypothetical protein